MMENLNPTTKKCPMCAEEIKAEARVCRYCKARFDVTIKGYCSHDHQLVAATAEGKCPLCLGELIDLRVVSRLAGEPAPVRTAVPVSVSPAPASRPDAKAPPAIVPPVASVDVSPVTRARTPYWQLYLSPKGRIGRLAFFLKGLFPVLGLLGLDIFMMVKIMESVNPSGSSGAADVLASIGLIIFLVGMLFLYWVLLALIIKRLHDLGRSGWNMLFWLIPLVGQLINLWNWVEFLFVKGAAGPNKFGDPAE